MPRFNWPTLSGSFAPSKVPAVVDIGGVNSVNEMKKVRIAVQATGTGAASLSASNVELQIETAIDDPTKVGRVAGDYTPIGTENVKTAGLTSLKQQLFQVSGVSGSGNAGLNFSLGTFDGFIRVTAKQNGATGAALNVDVDGTDIA